MKKQYYTMSEIISCNISDEEIGKLIGEDEKQIALVRERVQLLQKDLMDSQKDSDEAKRKLHIIDYRYSGLIL